ncbi:MAG: DUF4238 domain-containing protein [Sporichthyaceae bacterium]
MSNRASRRGSAARRAIRLSRPGIDTSPISDRDELDDAERRASDLLLHPRATIGDQHTVSEVLLKQFAEPIGQHLSVASHRHDLPGKCGLSGTRSAGVVKNFLRVDSASAERLWSTAESGFPQALRALPQIGILPLPERHAAVLRSMVALHFARSAAMTRIFDDAWQHVYDSIPEQILRERRELIERAYRVERRSRRRQKADLLAYLRSNRDAMDLKVFRSGAWMRVRVEDYYFRILADLKHRTIGVARAAEGEFVIGDNPVVLDRKGANAPGVLNGIGWFGAEMRYLPVSPHLLLLVGSEPRYAELNRDGVDEVNRRQVLSSVRRVWHRPGAHVCGLVDEALPAQEALTGGARRRC